MVESAEDMPMTGEASETELAEIIQIEQLDDADDQPPAAPVRDSWGSKMAYFLTLVGYAVGFGNIWRFPYQMRENGGLVFLIPYCIMLAIVGIPVFFLELAVGQRRRKGVVYAWAEISPLLGGLGITCGWLCFMVALYYNTLIAYCLSFFVDSFRTPLPWTNCTTVSAEDELQKECTNKVGSLSTKYYWFRKTLDISPRYEDPGRFNPWLLLYLAIAWTAVYLILVKGTKSVGAVVYVTAIFPYVVLVAFFIANCCIEPTKGWLGAYRLLKPDWRVLGQANTWLKAGSQIFFSLGLAQGCLVVFASYNPARNNCYKDAIHISIVNCSTSLFAALVVFPMIGALGHRKYEECYHQMVKLFGKNSNFASSAIFEKKYDIYFFTEAILSTDVSKQTPLSIGYRYGELESADLRDDGGKHNPWHAHEVITDQSTFDPNWVKSTPLASFLRTCSIGKEATASGGGSGFVFQAFTEAVKHMPWPNFWAVLFFSMLLFLGIDSGFGIVEGVIAAIEDLTRMKRFLATTIVCAVMAILAILLFSFGWGQYVLDLMDQWAANWTLLMVGLLECIAVAWGYGLAKISYDIRLMTGAKPNLYILICWKYLSPLIITAMLIGSVVQFIISNEQGVKYTAFDPKEPGSVLGDLKLNMPPWILAIGFLLMLFVVVWVPIHMVLRRSKFNMLKFQAPAEFPEDELREERGVNVDREEDQFTNAERALMGKQSLQNLQQQRDEHVVVVKSQTSLTSGTKPSSGNVSLEP